MTQAVEQDAHNRNNIVVVIIINFIHIVVVVLVIVVYGPIPGMAHQHAWLQ